MKNFALNRWLAFIHDILWIPIALILAYWVRFNLAIIPEYYWQGIFRLLGCALIIQTTCYWYFGLYRGIWRFASIPDVLRISKAVLMGVSLTLLSVFVIYRLELVPRSIFVLYPLLLFLGLSAPRFLYRWIKDKHLYLSGSQGKRVLLIGAGQAGEMLVRDMKRRDEYFPIGFLDDSKEKKGRDIHGVRVLDIISSIERILRSHEIELVIVCIRNIDAKTMRGILKSCSNNKVQCQTIPSLVEANDDDVDIFRLRDVSIEDLLGRQTIKLDDTVIQELIEDECVLVTGAGGSIGSELCRQALMHQPRKLILLENSEFNLYNVTNELKKLNESNIDVHSLLCSVRDINAVEKIFNDHKPNIVLHAAAYKHVPIIEDNIIEGVKTNIFGTKKIAEIAEKYKVEKFVMISTDKAVNPTSMMGVTKRSAEIFCQMLDANSTTQFITTRFGNVVDSAGSVVPLFREQISNGGPVTVTHKDITRYFMSIPEAVSLILQAASIGGGGEIFVLDMGKPIKIYDLARQMIRLSGNDPDEDIKIDVIGLRPGEKLYEELFHESEDYLGTKHPKILLAESRKVNWEQFSDQLECLAQACVENNLNQIIILLKEIIPEYHSDPVLKSDAIMPTSNSPAIH